MPHARTRSDVPCFSRVQRTCCAARCNTVLVDAAPTHDLPCVRARNCGIAQECSGLGPLLLKRDASQVPDKEKEVRELLECSEQDLKDHFHEFIDVSNRITDWGAEEEGGGSGEDDEMGVAVDFDDEAEEEEGGNGALPQPVWCTNTALQLCALALSLASRHVPVSRPARVSGAGCVFTA